MTAPNVGSAPNGTEPHQSAPDLEFLRLAPESEESDAQDGSDEQDLAGSAEGSDGVAE